MRIKFSGMEQQQMDFQASDLPSVLSMASTSRDESGLLADLSSDEQGCYSSSDGSFVPNDLGITIITNSYLICVLYYAIYTFIQFLPKEKI